MRLDEITKAEFVDGMRDPAMAELKKINKEIKALAGIDKLMYSVKTHEVEGSTRRLAFVTWNRHYIPDIGLVPVNIDGDIARHYKNNLQNWRLKGYSSHKDITEFELREA